MEETAPQLLRIGLAGCGVAARAHLARLAMLPDVEIVGCADTNLAAAERLASTLPVAPPAYADHQALLSSTKPDALAIFTPHRLHYRLAMDALQAGCHVFVEKPLSTNPQEAVDIVTLAKGRARLVGVGHQYRLCPSLREARRLLADGAIGRLRLVRALLAAPWLATHRADEESWRFDPKVSGGGILADAGDHILDALLWTTRQRAVEVAAFQDREAPGLDVATAAAIRLSDGTLAMLGLVGDATGAQFELEFVGERGVLKATDTTLDRRRGDGDLEPVSLPSPAGSIDSDFVAAIRDGQGLCCSGLEALDTVRLLDAITRAAASGQVVAVV